MTAKDFLGSPDTTLVADRSLSGLSGDASVAERKTGDPFVRHTARKQHRCDGYFFPRCLHGGVIDKGAEYWSPADDCKDQFHPYRICGYCIAEHARRSADTARAQS